VTAASAGVKAAQNTVLHSLYGVGTDMTVTESRAPGTNGGQSFNFSGPSQGSTTAPSRPPPLGQPAAARRQLRDHRRDPHEDQERQRSVHGGRLADPQRLRHQHHRHPEGDDAAGHHHGGTGERGSGGGGTFQGFGGPASGGGSFNSTSVTGVDLSNLTIGRCPR